MIYTETAELKRSVNTQNSEGTSIETFSTVKTFECNIQPDDGYLIGTDLGVVDEEGTSIMFVSYKDALDIKRGDTVVSEEGITYRVHRDITYGKTHGEFMLKEDVKDASSS